VKVVGNLTKLTQGMLIALLALVAALLFFAAPGAAEQVEVSPQQFDGFYYTPDESVTVTASGLIASVAYDIEISLPNGTLVMEQWNVTGDSNGDHRWAFDIPSDWEGRYDVILYQNVSGTYEDGDSIYVRLFWLSTELDHLVYLPGDTVSVFYYTQRLDDHKPLSSGVGRWKAQIQRDNGSNPVIVEDIGNSFTATSGKFSFTLPAGTLSRTYVLTVTFNDTTDKHSVSVTETLRVGELDLEVTLDRSTYEPGDSVVATVTADARLGGTTEPLEGVTISTVIYEYDPGNGTWGEDDTYSVSDQRTGFDGRAAFVVVIHADADDGDLYRVTVSATSGGTTHEASNTYQVYESATLLIDLEIKETSYKPGQTLEATVTLTTSNATLKSGAMYEWTVTSTSTGRTLHFAYSSAPTVSYGIPADFSGSIRVSVRVFTPDDQVYSRSDTVNVFSRALLINPSTAYFQPGDVVGVDVEVVSDQITEAVFVWTIVPFSGGDPVANGRVTGNKAGHFEFTVPDPSDSGYYIQVSASGSGIVVSDTASVSREKFVALEITVPQRSFQPGETIDIQWALTSVGGATLPPTTTLTVYLTGGFGSIGGSTRSFDVAGTSGTIPYTIPETAPENADLQLTVTGSGTTGAGTAVYMRPAGGATPVNAAADSAMIAILLAFFGILLAVYGLWRGSKGAGGGGSPPARESRRSYGDLKSDSEFGSKPKSGGAEDESKPIFGGGSGDEDKPQGGSPPL